MTLEEFEAIFKERDAELGRAVVAENLREIDKMYSGAPLTAPRATTEPRTTTRRVADNVRAPQHYTFGGIETIDYLRAKLTKEQLKGYYIGNLLKYLSRAGHKNGVEDYKKAEVYLAWLIELEEAMQTPNCGNPTTAL